MGELEVLMQIWNHIEQMQEIWQGNRHKKEIKTKVKAVWALGGIVCWREQIK